MPHVIVVSICVHLCPFVILIVLWVIRNCSLMSAQFRITPNTMTNGKNDFLIPDNLRSYKRKTNLMTWLLNYCVGICRLCVKMEGHTRVRERFFRYNQITFGNASWIWLYISFLFLWDHLYSQSTISIKLLNICNFQLNNNISKDVSCKAKNSQNWVFLKSVLLLYQFYQK